MRKLSLTACVLMAVLMSGPLFATATGTIAPFPRHQFFDNNGDPCNGCLLFTYTAGTSTKLSTYSEVTLTSANANPLTLPSTGRATIFLTPGLSYKFILAPATDVDPPLSPLWTVDNVGAVPPTGTATDVDISGTAGESLTAGDAVYMSDGSGGTTTGRWYKADADQVYSSSTAQAVGFATAAITTGSSGTIRRGGRITGLSGLTAGTLYYVSATGGALTSSAPTNVRAILQADATTAGVILTGEPLASATVVGVVGLVSQTLGTGVSTDVKTIGGLAVNSTPNYKPGGDSALDALASGILTTSVDSVQHANSGTGETDLSSYSLPANTLSANTKSIRVTFWGTLAANANTKTIKFKFGASSFTGYTSTGNGIPFFGVAIVQRTGAATQKVTVFVQTSTGTSIGASGTAAETLSGAVTVKTTGQSGTASSDILQENFFVEVLG